MWVHFNSFSLLRFVNFLVYWKEIVWASRHAVLVWNQFALERICLESQCHAVRHVFLSQWANQVSVLSRRTRLISCAAMDFCISLLFSAAATSFCFIKQILQGVSVNIHISTYWRLRHRRLHRTQRRLPPFASDVFRHPVAVAFLILLLPLLISSFPASSIGPPVFEVSTSVWSQAATEALKVAEGARGSSFHASLSGRVLPYCLSPHFVHLSPQDFPGNSHVRNTARPN